MCQGGARTGLVWLVAVRAARGALRHLGEAAVARREGRARLVELRFHLEQEGERAARVGRRRLEQPLVADGRRIPRAAARARVCQEAAVLGERVAAASLADHDAAAVDRGEVLLHLAPGEQRVEAEAKLEELTVEVSGEAREADTSRVHPLGYSIASEDPRVRCQLALRKYALGLHLATAAVRLERGLFDSRVRCHELCVVERQLFVAEVVRLRRKAWRVSRGGSVQLVEEGRVGVEQVVLKVKLHQGCRIEVQRPAKQALS